MKNKLFIQFFLFFILLLISIIFFNTYFFKKPNNNLKTNIVEEKNFRNEKKSSVIHNIEYASQDRQGNGYIIVSEYGELDNDQPDLILMKKVKATINLKESSPIIISSDEAVYNSLSYDTSFYNNVKVLFDENTIKSDNLDLLFKKNLATISKNIIFKNLNTELQADKVEIDLITKDSKIFMKNKSEKVKIVSTN